MSTFAYDPSLYQLTADYQNLLAMLLDTDADEEALIDTLDSIESMIAPKAEAYSIIISTLTNRSDFLKQEEKRLAERRHVIDNNIKRMKQALMDALIAVGTKRVETDHFTITVAKNGGKQSLDIFDAVPDIYTKQVVTPDTDAIRQALEEGIELPFAKLQERGESIRIK